MSLRPAFQIGLWNAWIIEVLGLLTLLPTLMSKEALKKRPEGEPTWSESSKSDKVVFLITHPIVVPFTLIYSIFLPLKVGTIWFYVGIPISILALVMGFMAGISFATGPFDKPITGGIYRISRHPWYFAWFLMFIGIGIACASWVFCAMRGGVDNLVEHWRSFRRTRPYREVRGRLSGILEQDPQMDRHTKIGGEEVGIRLPFCGGMRGM